MAGAGRKAAEAAPPAVITFQRLIWLGYLLAFGMLLISAVVLSGSRKNVRLAAERSIVNLVNALSRDIARNLNLLDLSLQGARDALKLPGIETTPRSIRQTALFDRAATAEYVGSILILDAEGRIRDASRDLQLGTPLGDRPYFQVHRDQPDAGLFVSRPFSSRLRQGDASIALSRRLNGPDGAFEGIVLGTLRLAYFSNLFSILDLGRNGVVTIVRADGTLVARHPAGVPGQDLSRSQVFRRMGGANSGSFVDVSSLDGIERLYAFQRLGDLPLVLAVGLASEDVYQNWWHEAAVIGAVLVALSLATVVLCLLVRRELARRVAVETELVAAAERMRVMASTDSLTGLANRRAFEAELEQEWRRAFRDNAELALVMLDADHFKAYNDLYGHPAGDAVLQRLAQTIRANVGRPGDIVARIGGEEFVALLPGTGQGGALVIAERIRDALYTTAIAHAGSRFGRMTFSIGIAAIRPASGCEPAVLVKSADTAMYRAKAAGRDRVETEPAG